MPNTATAVGSQASRPCNLLAAHEPCKLASLRRVFERAAPLHQKLVIGAGATISKGKELLGAPAPSRGKVSSVSTLHGGWDRLASAVRVRSPLASLAPLHWTPSAAPPAHTALDSP
eukprot:6672564-Prymnesium_polylepis.1